MCESTKLAQSHRFGNKFGKSPAQLTGWVGTFASIAAIVLNSGCCLDFGRRCRCCCHTSCERPIQVSDQYKAFQASISQKNTTTHIPPVATSKPIPKPDVNFSNVKFSSPSPKLTPIVPIETDKSMDRQETSNSILSNVDPETIDDMVDDLFERSQRRASGLKELPVGEIIEIKTPLKTVVEELSLETEDVSEPTTIIESLDDEAPQLNLSPLSEEPVAVVAQLPANSVSQPFRIANLPKTDENKFAVVQQDARNTNSGPSTYELSRIPKLQAIPVDKQNQRFNGVPLSNEAAKDPSSRLTILPNTSHSLLVMPGASPKPLDPAIRLEADGVRNIRPLPGVEKHSGESQSTLPPIQNVIR